MKYTALTIGPIIKTLKKAKSTKAIWGASYMFSYLMKNIIIEAKINPEDVLLPYFEPGDLNKKPEVGLFPDRLIIKKEVKDIQTNINAVLDEFAEKVSEDIKSSSTEVKQFFKEYISFHWIVIDVEKDENIIFKINELLDTAELKQKVISSYDTDFLKDFFENRFYNFLVKQVFEKKEQRFPSTIEIATAEYKALNDKEFNKYVQKLFHKQRDEDAADNQQRFIDEITKNDTFGKHKRNYQKYIAVVQADGDNIGSFIKLLYFEKDKDSLIERFSKHLLQFGKESVQAIKAYQGTPIYAGGDDLLFFCPVAHTGFKSEDKEKKKLVITKTFLSLIKQIDDIFNELFTEDEVFKKIIKKEEEKTNDESKKMSGFRPFKKPSLSFGVSISYYKFPLNEALEQGANQLFTLAKSTEYKNAVAYSVLKHSGQYFGALFHKHQNSFSTYEELQKQHISDENFLHGIVYKLMPQQSVFYNIGLIEEESERNTLFNNFFNNNFDESVHRKKEKKDELIPFLEKMKQLFKDVYSENKVFEGVDEKEKQEINLANLNKIYASLRFIGFLHNKEER